MTYYIKIGNNQLEFSSAKEAVEELKEAVITARLDADDEEEREVK